MFIVVLFIVFIILVVNYYAQRGKSNSDKRPLLYDTTLERIRSIEVTVYDNLRREETTLRLSPDATYRHPTNYEFFFDTFALDGDRFQIFDYTMVFIDSGGKQLPIDNNGYSWYLERATTPRLGYLHVSRANKL